MLCSWLLTPLTPRSVLPFCFHRDKKSKTFPPDFYIELKYRVVPPLKMPPKPKAKQGKAKAASGAEGTNNAPPPTAVTVKEIGANQSRQKALVAEEGEEEEGSSSLPKAPDNNEDEDDDDDTSVSSYGDDDDDNDEVGGIGGAFGGGGLSAWFATPYNRALIGLEESEYASATGSSGSDKRGSITGTGLTTAVGNVMGSALSFFGNNSEGGRDGAAAAEEEISRV